MRHAYATTLMEQPFARKHRDIHSTHLSGCDYGVDWQHPAQQYSGTTKVSCQVWELYCRQVLQDISTALLVCRELSW